MKITVCPIKKSLFLFNEFSATNTKPQNKLYSWTAKHIIVDRKKCILFVNDKSFLPAFIVDINVKNKSNLKDYIIESIKLSLRIAGIDFNKYFADINIDINVYKAYDNSIISSLNHQDTVLGFITERHPIDLSEKYQPKLIKELMNMPTKKLNYHSPLETMSNILNKTTSSEHLQHKTFLNKPKWADYSKFDKYKYDIDSENYEDEWLDDPDEIADSIREQNKKVLNEFEKWLENKNLSKKTIQNYLLNVGTYIDDYLIYEGCITLDDSELEIGGFFENWFLRKCMWSSNYGFVKAIAEIKNFYKFLFEKKVISNSQFNDAMLQFKENSQRWIKNAKTYNSLETEEDFEKYYENMANE